MGDDGSGQADAGSYRSHQLPNTKPQLGHGDPTNKQDQWKKSKPTKLKRSKSTDSERGGTDRGRRREYDTDPGRRRTRGRSEESHRRDGKETNPPKDEMDDTECVVCFCSYDNVFKTPKLLSCGHTFCLECLARINVSSQDLKTLCCPVCRELTKLPHGRNLPQLGNNKDIFQKMPPDMQKALSVRFKRSEGKLVLKNRPPNSPTKTSKLVLPQKKQGNQADVDLGTLEAGHLGPATLVDVGRPPSRVRGHLRRMFRSDRCYYVAVASIITITVALMLVGILAFVVMPNGTISHKPSMNNAVTQISKFTYNNGNDNDVPHRP